MTESHRVQVSQFVFGAPFGRVLQFYSAAKGIDAAEEISREVVDALVPLFRDLGIPPDPPIAGQSVVIPLGEEPHHE